MSALRDEVFDSQEVDDEENNIPGAGSSNNINIQEVNDDERDNEADVDEEADEGGEDDDLLHVPSRKRKLNQPCLGLWCSRENCWGLKVYSLWQTVHQSNLQYK